MLRLATGNGEGGTGNVTSAFQSTSNGSSGGGSSAAAANKRTRKKATTSDLSGVLNFSFNHRTVANRKKSFTRRGGGGGASKSNASLKSVSSAVSEYNATATIRLLCANEKEKETYVNYYKALGGTASQYDLNRSSLELLQTPLLRTAGTTEVTHGQRSAPFRTHPVYVYFLFKSTPVKNRIIEETTADVGHGSGVPKRDTVVLNVHRNSPDPMMSAKFALYRCWLVARHVYRSTRADSVVLDRTDSAYSFPTVYVRTSDYANAIVEKMKYLLQNSCTTYVSELVNVYGCKYVLR